MVCFVSGAERAVVVGSSSANGSALEIAGADRDDAVRGEDGAREPIPVASVVTPAEDCTTAAMISIDRSTHASVRVRAPSRAKVNRRAPPDCAAPLAESSMRITSASAMARSMSPTSPERTGSTPAARLMRATSLAARGLPREPSRQMFGRDARYGEGGDGRHDKCPSRPTDRRERQRQAAGPRTSQGAIPLACLSPTAVAMRDEWRGRSSNRDSRRRARFHSSPPIDWRVTNERSSVSCRRWRVAVRGRVTGAGVKLPRLLHGAAETEVADGPPRVDLARRARK